jgi:carbamoylphosphate synthase large subunit
MVEKVIAIERPDALLPTMGGQTALNCALDLARHGVLEKYGVEMIGARKEAIDKAEDREKFKQAMSKIGLASAPLRDRAQSGGSIAGADGGGLPDHHPAIVPRSAGRGAASHTTGKSFSRSASAGSKLRPRTRCWSRSR